MVTKTFQYLEEIGRLRSELESLKLKVSNPQNIVLPRSLVNTAVNGYVQEQGHALNEIRELLGAKP